MGNVRITVIDMTKPAGQRITTEPVELGDNDCQACFDRWGRVTDHQDAEDSCILDIEGGAF